MLQHYLVWEAPHQAYKLIGLHMEPCSTWGVLG